MKKNIVLDYQDYERIIRSLNDQIKIHQRNVELCSEKFRAYSDLGDEVHASKFSNDLFMHKMSVKSLTETLVKIEYLKHNE